MGINNVSVGNPCLPFLVTVKPGPLNFQMADEVLGTVKNSFLLWTCPFKDIPHCWSVHYAPLGPEGTGGIQGTLEALADEAT